MRRTKRLLTCALALLAFAGVVPAQETNTSETDDYALDLPTQVWKAVPRSDSVRQSN